MPEHTIPESLIQTIKSGRAVLVVGAGLGLPSWKQLLEKMNDRLAEQGPAEPNSANGSNADVDANATKDVAKLLHKGSLARAAGFLARALGPEVCDEIVAATWSTPEPLPELAVALGKLPFRQVWTTFPGDVLERAMAADRPDDWPEPAVVTYREAAEISPRRRTLLKILGDFESYAVTPASLRRALASADELRQYAREFYRQGTLVLVGFRYGDPDLGALLDRVLGVFDVPESRHYMVASGVGPVTVDELKHEHHIEVINLPGKGVDDTATTALLDYLRALSAACSEAGITPAPAAPDADDLDGWVAVWKDDPEAAAAA
ncbi:MAG: SIR2 family protein, partial [Myxococcota bacterium]